MSTILLIATLASGTPRVLAVYPQPNLAACEEISQRQVVLESWKGVLGKDVVIWCEEKEK